MTLAFQHRAVMLGRMLDDARHHQLLALLAWWRDAGVDVALDETAIDWASRGETGPGADFLWPAQPSNMAVPSAALQTDPLQHAALPAHRAAPPPATLPPVQRSAPLARVPATIDTTPSIPRAPMLPPSAAAMAARQTARKASTLSELEAILRTFEGCPLKATAKNLCFFRGSPQARLMVIGEAPGREEDLDGRPFVGQAGQLLDRMLASIGMSEADVHIANIVYWRPPGNRTPTLEEVEVCRPFVERQIELVAPELILTLGSPSAKAILGATEGILRVRGRWGQIAIGERRFRVLPTLHPAYLVRTPAAKRHVWRDLLAVKLALASGDKGEVR
jgi:uracil-DNA glycosylase